MNALIIIDVYHDTLLVLHRLAVAFFERVCRSCQHVARDGSLGVETTAASAVAPGYAARVGCLAGIVRS